MIEPRCPKCDGKLERLWSCDSCECDFGFEDTIKEPEDIAMIELYEFLRDNADTSSDEHRAARRNLDIIAATIQGLKNAIAALQKIHGPLYR